jgi:ATP-dependent Clp protease ATP-binding subunit ClpA
MTLAKELENTLNLAIAEARRRRHEFVTLEHLLLALCADPIAARILRGVGADLGKLAKALEEVLSGMPALEDGDKADP